MNPLAADVRDHFSEEQKHVYNSLTGPSGYALKALWLPPGTPDHIADAVSSAFEEALTTNDQLITKYSNVAGESPAWVGRDDLKEATIYNEGLLEGSQALIDEQKGAAAAEVLLRVRQPVAERRRRNEGIASREPHA